MDTQQIYVEKEQDGYLVEAEVALEYGVAEPDFTEGVEELFIVVVGHSSSVLDLTEHVANTRPNHALNVQHSGQ